MLPPLRLLTPLRLLLACLVLLAGGTGCRSVEMRNRLLEAQIGDDVYVPSELNKVSLPTYVIEPPDILLVDAVKVVPKAPYHIEPLDVLQIMVEGTPPEYPIVGLYRVEVNGNVNLGPLYGSVHVADLTPEEASEAIRQYLTALAPAPLAEVQVSVSLAESAGQQQIAGEHLVTLDGTVNLGTYGSVYVAGLTLREARAEIERHLSEFLQDPEISVDVFSYNSKVYYLITEGAGFGEQVTRLPITGNETVLDALSMINGLSRVSSKTIWVARPAPDGTGCYQVLPVNWHEITRGASPATNYQILPGDRIFIAEDRLIAFDSLVGRVLQPFERMFGFTLLGTQTIQAINRFPDGLGRRGQQQQFF